MTRIVLAVLWLLFAAVPLLWWVNGRRKVDVWRALPVPAALLAVDGAVVRRTGPSEDVAFDVVGGLPARGHVMRVRDRAGTWLALSGLRGGALAIALPADAVAERRDRVLAELGARLAHDINTPLSALHGHLDLIAHETISPSARESVQTCQRELTRLQTTAQDLLTFTRLRAGGGQRSTHYAGALAEEAAAALLDQADAAQATLRVTVPVAPVRVEVAEADVVRALRNLIANALAYGLGEQRDVEVAVRADADSVTFSVADSGKGMAQDELDALSEPLVRGAGTGPGTGLGLTIVVEVLAGHGGRLRAERVDDGRFALAFTLPRTA
jgi:signal transduction histidine kinase